MLQRTCGNLLRVLKIYIKDEERQYMNPSLFSSKNMNWCTPQDFFDDLDKEFHFVLDAAATDKSAKCRLYFTPETDGLSQSWDCGGAVFCNPPYGKDIKRWVAKAHEEAAAICFPIVLLIPARTDTRYFHDYIYGKAELRFVRGRLKFTDENGNVGSSAPFPSMIVIYNTLRTTEQGEHNEQKYRRGETEKEIAPQKIYRERS